MSTDTKKQHYVWEYYLKAWATKNKIWCLRKGKPLHTSTENIAHERYFYRTSEFTPSEIKLVESILSLGKGLARTINLDTFRTYIEVSHASERSRRFGVEWHHGIIENKALPIMKALRAGNPSILGNQKDRIDFCIFLGQQYMRTKKIKESRLELPDNQAIPDEYKNCNFQKIYEALAFVYANNLGAQIHDTLEIRLVKNTSNINLITSDQPIYNLAARPGEEAPEISIYYPVNPRLAIFARKSPNLAELDTEAQVAELNAFMASNSHELLFAQSREDLQAFVSG
ncbi:DUF4238 domain-containing protein [Paraburkholderia kururiensis]|uniref:DUF4238 domain-containing protein n=1 Tax=Paraburkholderia kururiensis TaxID=984307 RepID=UPI0039A78512